MGVVVSWECACLECVRLTIIIIVIISIVVTVLSSELVSKIVVNLIIIVITIHTDTQFPVFVININISSTTVQLPISRSQSWWCWVITLWRISCEFVWRYAWRIYRRCWCCCTWLLGAGWSVYCREDVAIWREWIVHIFCIEICLLFEMYYTIL